ncbi:AtpZ/AtpI family protein [Methylothermus subterraneus]
MTVPKARDWLLAIRRQVRRIKRAEEEERTLLAQLTYLGTAGLVLALPVVAGAYLGNWLDRQLSGYSMRWTLSLIFVGLVLGGVNLWLLFKEE